jgi:hypothetical protein
MVEPVHLTKKGLRDKRFGKRGELQHNNKFTEKYAEEIKIIKIMGLLVAIATGLFGTANSIYHWTDSAYLQKTQPDLQFWGGWGYIDNTVPVLAYHINGNGSDVGAALELCSINKGKLDTGPMNFFIKDVPWLDDTHVYLENISSKYTCAKFYLRQRGDCFIEKKCDISQIPKGVVGIKIKYICATCEPHIGEISLNLCIEDSNNNCKKYQV